MLANVWMHLVYGRDPTNFADILNVGNGRGRPHPSTDPTSQNILLDKSIQNFMKRITDYFLDNFF